MAELKPEKEKKEKSTDKHTKVEEKEHRKAQAAEKMQEGA